MLNCLLPKLCWDHRSIKYVAMAYFFTVLDLCIFKIRGRFVWVSSTSNGGLTDYGFRQYLAIAIVSEVSIVLTILQPCSTHLCLESKFFPSDHLRGNIGKHGIWKGVHVSDSSWPFWRVHFPVCPFNHFLLNIFQSECFIFSSLL